MLENKWKKVLLEKLGPLQDSKNQIQEYFQKLSEKKFTKEEIEESYSDIPGINRETFEIILQENFEDQINKK